MKKEERIARYGEEAYQKQLAQQRTYYKANKEEENARAKKWREEHQEQVKAYIEEHSEQVIANNHESDRKGGKHYAKKLEYNHTGLRGERSRIRVKHAIQWRPFKTIVAPESQIHHEWIPDTSDYRGVALVEANAHQYGIIDVIQILEGKITLLTEEQVIRREPEGL